MTRTMMLLLTLLFTATHVHLSSAHGLMVDPPQRGTLSPFNRFSTVGTDKNAPTDQKAHFPAGDKDKAPGAAARSQLRAAGPDGWVPFEPLRSGFRWRAGVCGDELGKKQDHMRGGYYYYGGKITRTYEAGSVMQVELNIVAHHNGFVEMHMCDVDKCGGEISEACFREGHCRQLQRAPDRDCDSGYDLGCGPIDPAYPGRWYLPCRKKPDGQQERFGINKMKWTLPADLTCEHCVAQFFWSAANTCNPPGVIEYFEGGNGPKRWGDCPGQSGALGGYTKVQKDCSAFRNPEEYYTCADVRIEAPRQQPVSAEDAAVPDEVEKSGRFEELVLVGDGDVIGALRDGEEVDVRPYKNIAIEAVTSSSGPPVDFFLDGEEVWKDYNRPYFLYGNKGRTPNYGDLVYNRDFELAVQSGDDRMQVRVKLVK